MNIYIARHNGLGDVIMTLPFIGHYLSEGHGVFVECDVSRGYGDWIPRLFPGVRVGGIPPGVDVYHDFRSGRSINGNVILNFNRIELLDGAAVKYGAEAPNKQFSMCGIAALAGLSLPPSLSPGDYAPLFERSSQEKILLFTKSTNPSRAIGPRTVAAIKARYEGIEMIVDPQYPSTWEYFKGVALASLVISPCTSANHIAETVGTKWVNFGTTFDHNSIYRFYKHGRTIQSNALESPCYRHDWCGKCGNSCTDDFDLSSLPDVHV